VVVDKCILCDRANIVLIDSISSLDLTKLYKNRAKVDVERLFIEKPNINYYSCTNCELRFYLPQVIGDGAFYDTLQNYDGYYLTDKSEFCEAAKWINNADNVLEIGCGTGNFSSFIKYKSFTGLEFSEKSIQIARNKGLNVINESLEDHAEANKNKYDAVCYFQVLEHVSNPNLFIKDSISCLKPGGKLIIAVPSEDSFIHGAVNAYLNMPPHHASRWPDETLKKVASLFNITFVTLLHEPLHKRHRLFYTKTKIYHALNKLFHLEYRLIDRSNTNTFLYIFAALLSYVVTPFLSKKKNIRGQSMIAVFKKT
jgi:2-polyprenyl-3-methyl-5-hydroxy-6-metoxy-1,4-benzoquinol methylase